MAKDAEMEPVYVAYGLMQAEIIRAKLEAAGIPAILKYESAGQVFPVLVNGLGEVKVVVRAADAVEARALLEGPAEPAPETETDGEGEPAGDA